MKREQCSTGVGLDSRSNVILKIDELRPTLDALANALKEGDEKAKNLVSAAVRSLRESGARSLKAASEAEEGHGEVTHLYNRTINRLQTAADKGDVEAIQLLAEMGP